MTTGDKLFLFFIEHSLDKIIYDIINNPEKAIKNLKRISKELNLTNYPIFSEAFPKLFNENSPFFIYLQMLLERTKRSIIRRFVINIALTIRDVNKSIKPIVLHFDFRVSRKLSVKQIENLFTIDKKVAYACFFPGDYPELSALTLALSKQESLFFLFLEPDKINQDVVEKVANSENIGVFLNINHPKYKSISEILENTNSLYGFYLSLNNENIKKYTAASFLNTLKERKSAGLIYVRDEVLNPKNKDFYFEFLKEARFRFSFPLIDYHEDQKFIIKTLRKNN
jgi:hypothetical protein